MTIKSKCIKCGKDEVKHEMNQVAPSGNVCEHCIASDMNWRYPKAEKFISDLLLTLCPAAHIESFYMPSTKSFDYRLEFGLRQIARAISFGEALLDDLEEVLKRNGASLHDDLIKSKAQFIAYINLGKVGLMPQDFLISEKIASERGDWKFDLNITIDFDRKFTAEIAKGLNKIHNFLEGHLVENHDLEEVLAGLARSRDRITQLLQYYHDKKSLNDRGVSTETLMYFKTAVLTQIIEKEARRGKQPMRLIRGAIDSQIYMLAEKLRGEDFLFVPIPDWFLEFREIFLINLQSIKIAEKTTTEVIKTIQVDSTLPDENYFPKGSHLDIQKAIAKIIGMAKRSVWICDSYMDEKYIEEIPFDFLDNVRLLTLKYNPLFRQRLNAAQQQYAKAKIEAKKAGDCHDRFIVIDENQVWSFGASYKDAGNKATFLAKVNDSNQAKKIITDFNQWWNVGNPIAID